MAGKSKTDTGDEPLRRFNRAVDVGEALRGTLDSALRKRGFASRDLLTNWAVIAPKPYDRLALPDQLKWPRGAGHEGATLLLRVAPGHALAVSHEAPLIATAINRYFGYFLVREVKLSAEPLAPPAPKPETPMAAPLVEQAARTAARRVENPDLRQALEALGKGVLKPPG